MQKIRSEFPEIEEIKHDIDSLKTNVVELTRHVHSEGKIQAHHLSDVALERFSTLKKSAQAEYRRAEKQIQAKPGQSVALAFAAGLAVSFLLGRRG